MVTSFSREGLSVSSKLLDIITGFIAYVLFYIFFSNFVGILSAIAIPGGYIDWFRSHDMLWLGIRAFNYLMVDIPGWAAPSFTLAFITARFFSKNWLLVCITILILFYSHYWLHLLQTSDSISQLIELNGYTILLPSFMPLIFTILGGWLGDQDKKNGRRLGAPIVMAIFIVFCILPFLLAFLFHRVTA